MNRRQEKILRWLGANPGWHSTQEIGVNALGLQPRAVPGAHLLGILRRLQTLGKIELGPGKVPGSLHCYRIKTR